MIVADETPRLHAQKSVKDIQPGDSVRLKGQHGVGFVESMTDDDHAWVTWKSGLRSLEPLAALRKCRAVGHSYDSRRGE